MKLKVLTLLLFMLISSILIWSEGEIIEESNLPSYNDKRMLTLEKAIEIALANNHQVMQAQYSMKASEYDMKNSISNLLPKIQLTQRYSRIDNNTYSYANAAKDVFEEIFGLPPGTIPPFVFRDTYATHIIVDQPVYYGGALRSGINLARNAKEMSKYSFEDAKENIILETKKAYHNYLKANEMLNLMKRSVELAQANLKDTQLKMEQGLRSRSDMLRWEVQLADEKSRLIDAESNLDLASINLKNVLGIKFTIQYEVLPVSPEKFSLIYKSSQKLIEKEEQNLLSIASKAAQSHPISKIASTNIRIKSAQVDVAKSAFKPQVSFNYNYGWRENDTLALDDFQSWSASVVVSFSIFNGFGDIWNVKKNEKELQASREAEKLAQRNVAVQLIAAFYQVKSALSRIEVTQKGLVQAEENLRIVKDKYDLGMASNIELIDAQVTLTRSEINQINSHYDLLVAVAELERAQGYPLE